MKMMLARLSLLLVGGFNLFQICQAFQLGNSVPRTPKATAVWSIKEDSAASDESLLVVRNYLEENYAGMYRVLKLNDSIWKFLAGGEEGFTIFAASSSAWTKLGETKQGQLLDPRNLETSQKIAAYHVISETVTADQLFNSGGVITLGGQIPIERSRTGGMFGLGGKEDGGVTINGAKVIRTVEVGSGLIHEVDDLVSPSVLWRFMDQLRIPGSK